RNARRSAEPKLERWLAQMIGAPKTVRTRAELLDSNGKVILVKDPVRLDVLGVGSLDALYLSGSASPDLPSDLERLLEHVVLRNAGAAVPPGTRVRFGRERAAAFAAADLSLGEYLEANAAFRRAVLTARTVDAPDFHEDGGPVASAADGAELAKRADRAVATLKAARDRLTQRIAAGATDPLRDALVDLVFLGIPEAVPGSA